MTYFKEQTYGTRVDISLDAARFMADIAAALGGSDVDVSYQGGSLKLGELALYFRAGYGAKAKRVTVSSGIADREAHRRAYAASKMPDFPTITIDPDRPLDVIVKDIKRRVIEPAAGPLEVLRQASAAQADTFATLKRHAETLNALFPGVVTMPDDDTKREAGFYLNQGGIYLSGRVNSDGGLYVDRLGTVPAGKLVALIALLTS